MDESIRMPNRWKEWTLIKTIGTKLFKSYRKQLHFLRFCIEMAAWQSGNPRSFSLR